MTKYYAFVSRRVCLLLAVFFWLQGTGAVAQTNDIIVSGSVSTDTSVLEGVTITVKGNPAKTARTNAKGQYAIKAPSNGTLLFSFIGFETKEVEIRGENNINVLMQSVASALDGVAVVAYGTQKKSSMVSSITTLDPRELKGPTSNLTTMLAGRISGVIAYQRSGEPGQDNANFFIRGVTTFGSGKVNPLILIDGMESTTNDLARLQPDDISGFSVLKDATASSLYGARGANGVILVTTKLGREGKAQFNVRLESSLSGNTRNFKLADNITYMKLANEAVLTRYPLIAAPYAQEKIDQTAAGADPYLYPSNNWMKTLIKDRTLNTRANVNLSGGGKIARYYVAGTMNTDNGILKIDKLNNFNSNIKLRNYSIRSNIFINVTKSTEMAIRTYGQFDDYRGPVGGGALIFDRVLHSNPVRFPAIYPASFAPNISHPLFGNALTGSGTTLFENPYARAVSGYQDYNTSTMVAQLDFKQDFSFITKGLSATFMAYTQRFAYFDVSRRYTPFYYSFAYAPGTKQPVLSRLNDNGTEYLSYVPGSKILSTIGYAQASVNYNRIFNKHAVSGMLIGTMRSQLNAAANDLQTSLPYRNQGMSGRFTYGYDNRYLAEFNFGYNGSERFAKNNRYGFFPSVGVAWNVHSEKFWEPVSGVVNRLKLRATYGMVGNDQIGDSTDRFFYLSNVNMSNTARPVAFGENFSKIYNTIAVTRYSNTEIGWEKAYKTNIGFDARLFNALEITVDLYKEHRTNILMDRAYVPSTMGLTAPIRANIGEAEGKGIDVQLDYNKSLSKAVWITGRANFTYAASKLLVTDEPAYPEYWRSRKGHSLSQQWGLIAERLFIDDKEVANSPRQNFGEVKGGDLKYRDVNGDGEIETADNVPVGLPTVPEIIYGFGFSCGVKNFDFSAFFQGSARSSFFVDNNSVQPFRLNEGSQNGLLSAIAESHWSEDNRDIYAFWPRLSDQTIQNNAWNSTWWMRSGSFLRLKTVELGYTFPKKGLLERLRFSNMRVYLNGSNFFAISSFKLWDPEMGGNGLGYPVQRVFNAGVNFGF